MGQHFDTMMQEVRSDRRTKVLPREEERPEDEDDFTEDGETVVNPFENQLELQPGLVQLQRLGQQKIILH